MGLATCNVKNRHVTYIPNTAKTTETAETACTYTHTHKQRISGIDFGGLNALALSLLLHRPFCLQVLLGAVDLSIEIAVFIACA